MRIAYVYDAIARIGGVERILVDKMNYMVNQYGYEIYLITAAQGNHNFPFSLSPRIKHIDINVRFHIQYQYKYPKRLWMKWKMNQRFKRQLEKQIYLINPDVIIGTTYYKADIICKLKYNAKIIIESHCAKSFTGVSDGIKRNLFIDFLHKKKIKRSNAFIEKNCDAFIALTQGDASEWKTNNKTYIIPNAIPYIPRQSSDCLNNRAISVGRLIHQKGFDRLILAWKYIYKKYPDWKLDIYGEGEEYEALNKQIQTLELTKIVSIHPFTHKIKKEYCNSSLYILPSRYEGFGLVLIEAMSYGVPCVAFDCPYGPSDIIRNKEDGLLAENENVDSLIQSISILIENKKLRKEYSQRARENVKRYLTSEIMPLWFNLLENIK